MRMKMEEKLFLIKEALEIFLNNKINVWFSVKKTSIYKILIQKGLSKKIAASVIKILINSNVIEKRGISSSTEYKLLRKPTNLNQISENILNDCSIVRNKEYLFGKEKLELGKKYYMIFGKNIVEIQVVSIKIKNKENEIFYDVKKPINSKNNKTTILKNIRYKDVFLTVTSAGDTIKDNAIRDCKFIIQKDQLNK